MRQIRIDQEKCILCRRCVKACPVGALEAAGGRMQVNSACTLCSMCVESCPKGAISVPSRGGGVSAGSEGDLWVWIQSTQGTPVQGSLELLSRGRELADEKRSRLIAVYPGRLNGEAQRVLASCGADQILYADSPFLERQDPDAMTAWLCSLIRERDPAMVLFPATILGREVAPAAAARIGTGLTADCTELTVEPESGLLQQTRPAFGGNLMATIICPNHRPQMATVREGIFPVKEKPSAGVEIGTPFLEDYVPRRHFTDASGARENSLDITAAERLVVVGRGIGSRKNLPLMREFAERIGAQLGCSRPLVEAGWCEYAAQVGQTGHTVSPRLLVSVGVSGAIQHLAGISGAEKIVAINNDEKAPIFGVADYAVVGDCIRVIREFLA